jgi:hypothetical protein
VADVDEEEAVQGASETVEESAAAVVDDEAGISEPEQEALSRDIEKAVVQEQAPAEVLCESPDKLQLIRLLKQYGLEDEADVLALNGVKKDRDLSFIDEDVIKDLGLTPVSKAKLRKLVNALGAPAPEETSEPMQEGGDKQRQRVSSVESGVPVVSMEIDYEAHLCTDAPGMGNEGLKVAVLQLRHGTATLLCIRWSLSAGIRWSLSAVPSSGDWGNSIRSS